MKDPIHVMLIEDHSGYRQVITQALQREPSIQPNHQFSDSESALRSLQKRPSPLTPDIILLDLNLPGMSGLESIPWFQQYSPQSKIIILSQSEKLADIVSAIQLGVAGYLLKTATIQQITKGIKTVMLGGAPLDPLVAQLILKTLREKPKESRPEKELSERELEILTLLGDGLVKKEIADRLKISITTVAYHVRHIYEKLRVVNAPAAIKTAYEMGLFHSNEAN